MNVKFIYISCLLALTPFVSHAMSIHDYAKDGNYSRVSQLVQDNPSLVNSRDQNNATPLHSAAYAGHTNIATLLLANNADHNLQNNAGWTPLHRAAVHRHTNIVQLLLENGANSNVQSNAGMTPVDLAAPEVRNAIERPVRNGCCAALLCGHHPRCGANSILMQLPPAIMQDIVEHCKQIDPASYWILYGRTEAFTNSHLRQSRYAKAYTFLKNHWLKILVPTVAASAVLAWYLLPS